MVSGASASEHGVVSGILNLSRNLGLVTGASAMGAIFAWGTAAQDVMTASPEAIYRGLHATFAVAAVLIVVSLLISFRPGLARRSVRD